jgi:hypothetical protein
MQQELHSMNGLVSFVTRCPECVTMSTLPLAFSGRKIICPHCNSTFIATPEKDRPERIPDLDQRIQRLLDQADQFASSRQSDSAL